MDLDDPSLAYEMQEELGSGSFGVVYKAREKSTGELVAIKHIDLDGTDDDIRDIQEEISCLSSCTSPFVTKYKTSFVRGVKLWIVMEFLGGGSCLDLAKEGMFNEAHIAIICKELLSGLDYLHNTGKIHRDIKSANILLSSTGRVKIADFGVAAQLTSMKSQRMTFVGTPYWMAPEVIEENGYDFKADIWSLGITAMELISGEPPNADLHPMKALFHIPKNPAPRLEGQFSRDFKSFVAACLIKDADERPTARELLQHRFVQRAGRVTLLKDLVNAVDRKRAASPTKKDVKYYEETLRDMPRPIPEEDDWVFETVKAAPRPVPPVPLPTTQSEPQVHTIKKRKLSQASIRSTEPPTEMMERLDLNNPEPAEKVEMTPLPQNTVRTIQRRHSAAATGTARRITTASRRQSLLMPPTPSSGSPSPNASPCPSPSKPRQRQPLAVDTSFGNSPSSARPFRRVSEERYTPQNTTPIYEQIEPTTSTPPNRDNAENIPPPADAITREAKLGRKIFAKVVDPAFQATYAHTASSASREALAMVGLAWSRLDAVDPEGGAAFFRAIAEKLQSEPKLSAAVLPARAPSTPSSRHSSATSAQGTPTRTPSATPRRAVGASETGSPQKPSGKLILAQNNPHLQSHARRQSSGASLVSATGDKPSPALSRSPSKVTPIDRTPSKLGLDRSPSKASKLDRSPSKMAVDRSPSKAGALDRSPSKAMRRESTAPDLVGGNGGNGVNGQAQPGSEQSRRLSDALYARWVEGMRQRWPQQG